MARTKKKMKKRKREEGVSEINSNEVATDECIIEIYSRTNKPAY